MKRSTWFVVGSCLGCLLGSCIEDTGSTSVADPMSGLLEPIDVSLGLRWTLQTLTDRIERLEHTLGASSPVSFVINGSIEDRLTAVEKRQCNFDGLCQQRLAFVEEDVGKLKTLCEPLEMASLFNKAKTEFQIERERRRAEEAKAATIPPSRRGD